MLLPFSMIGSMEKEDAAVGKSELLLVIRTADLFDFTLFCTLETKPGLLCSTVKDIT